MVGHGAVPPPTPLSPSPSPQGLGACSTVQIHWRAVIATCVPASPVAGGPMSRLGQGSEKERQKAGERVSEREGEREQGQ